MTFLEQFFLFSLLGLVFIGGIISIYPSIKRGVDGKINFYLSNFIVGVVLIIFSTMATYGLAEDFYKCEILRIPNCD